MEPTEFVKRCIASLGVKDEAEALQAITTSNHVIASLQEACAVTDVNQILPAVRAARGVVAQVEQVTGATGPAALGALSGIKSQADKVGELTAKVTAYESEASDYAKTKRVDKVKAMLDKAEKDGLVPPAERPSLQAQGEKDDDGVAWLEGNLAVRSPVVATKKTKSEERKTGGEGAAVQLTATELKVCKAAGMSAEDFAAEKALQAKERAERPDQDEENDD